MTNLDYRNPLKIKIKRFSSDLQFSPKTLRFPERAPSKFRNFRIFDVMEGDQIIPLYCRTVKGLSVKLFVALRVCMHL